MTHSLNPCPITKERRSTSLPPNQSNSSHRITFTAYSLNMASTYVELNATPGKKHDPPLATSSQRSFSCVTSHETVYVTTKRSAVYRCPCARKSRSKIELHGQMLLYTPILNFILVRYVFPKIKHEQNDKLKFPVTLSLHPKSNKIY
jgi:hypothetical protein